jgi:hypothetical protein
MGSVRSLGDHYPEVIIKIIVAVFMTDGWPNSRVTWFLSCLWRWCLCHSWLPLWHVMKRKCHHRHDVGRPTAARQSDGDDTAAVSDRKGIITIIEPNIMLLLNRIMQYELLEKLKLLFSSFQKIENDPWSDYRASLKSDKTTKTIKTPENSLYHTLKKRAGKSDVNRTTDAEKGETSIRNLFRLRFCTTVRYLEVG